MVVLAGSFWSDTPTPVGSHLRHPRGEVLHPLSQAVAGIIGLLLGWNESMTSGGFAHEELLRIKLNEIRLVFRNLVGAISEQGLALHINQSLKHLTVIDMSGIGLGL
jgi:hypothetical protein